MIGFMPPMPLRFLAMMRLSARFQREGRFVVPEGDRDGLMLNCIGHTVTYADGDSIMTEPPQEKKS